MYTPRHRVWRGLIFFDHLKTFTPPEQTTVLLGGDYICEIENELERYGGSLHEDAGAVGL